ATGFVKGDMNNLTTDLTVNSTDGGAKINGTLVNITDKNKARYNVALEARNLKLGSMMQNPKLGPLTADIKANGTGYDPKTANATFTGIVSDATLNNYHYHDIKANGNIANQKYTVNATVHDPNLDAVVYANGTFSGKYPSLVLKSTIDSIKTLPLHLTTNKMIYHGRIDANFSDLDPDHLNGTLDVTHSILVNDSQRITIDSLSLVALNSGGNQSLTAKTDFLSASINGQYKLTQLADVFQQAIDPYFSISNQKNKVKVDPYHFTLTAGVVNNAALQAFLPSVKQFRPVSLKGN